MSKRAVVCIHVFPSLDYLEIVQLEQKHGGNVEKASSLPGAFDQTSRQIEDVEQLGQIIKDLYDSNRVPQNTPAVLVLPSFFTREVELPSDMVKEEIQATLLAEAERFYVFKKNEPQIDWIRITETKLLYTAYPKTELDKYVEIFQSHKIPLQAIELNYFALLRGLVASGAINDEISQKKKWCLVAITDNTFFAAVCDGGKIERTTESPLSFGIGEDLSAIADIQHYFEQFMTQQAYTKLILVNNSERLATEVLVSRLNIQEQVLVIEQNAKTLRSRGDMSAIYPCSLEGIGGTLHSQLPELPAVNLMPELTEDLVAILNMQQILIKGLSVMCGLALLICLAVWGLMAFMVMIKEGEIKEVGDNIAKLRTGQSSEDVVRKRFIKKAVDMNKMTNNLVVKVGSTIPNEIWLDHLKIEYEPKLREMMVSLSGGALTPEHVELFFNDLKKATEINSMEVGQVYLATGPDGHSYYSWTIRSKALSDSGH